MSSTNSRSCIILQCFYVHTWQPFIIFTLNDFWNSLSDWILSSSLIPEAFLALLLLLMLPPFWLGCPNCTQNRRDDDTVHKLIASQRRFKIQKAWARIVIMAQLLNFMQISQWHITASGKNHNLTFSEFYWLISVVATLLRETVDAWPRHY